MGRFEEIFVKITKSLFLILTIATFIGGIGGMLYIWGLSNSKAPQSREYTSSTLENYVVLLETKHSEKYKTSTPSGDKKSSDRSSAKIKNIDTVQRIIKNLNEYAVVVGEDPISDTDKFIAYLNKRIPAVKTSENTLESILNNLEEETSKLKNHSDRLSELPVTDIRRIYTRDFIKWFFDDYEKQLNLIRIGNAKAIKKVQSDKLTAAFYTTSLPFIGGAFIFFLTFLILIRVDLGIRKISKHIENAENPSE